MNRGLLTAGTLSRIQSSDTLFNRDILFLRSTNLYSITVALLLETRPMRSIKIVVLKAVCIPLNVVACNSAIYTMDPYMSICNTKDFSRHEFEERIEYILRLPWERMCVIFMLVT
jgi:hypothetical protein